MSSFKHWTMAQWAQLHRAFREPADSDIVQAIIDGAGVVEPSDWDIVHADITPWVHITSAFVHIAHQDEADVAAFLTEIRRYVPEREDARLSLAALVSTLTSSLEQTPEAMANWDKLRQLVGMPPQFPVYSNATVGEWSLD